MELLGNLILKSIPNALIVTDRVTGEAWYTRCSTDDHQSVISRLKNMSFDRDRLQSPKPLIITKLQNTDKVLLEFKPISDTVELTWHRVVKHEYGRIHYIDMVNKTSHSAPTPKFFDWPELATMLSTAYGYIFPNQVHDYIKIKAGKFDLTLQRDIDFRLEEPDDAWNEKAIVESAIPLKINSSSFVLDVESEEQPNSSSFLTAEIEEKINSSSFPTAKHEKKTKNSLFLPSKIENMIYTPEVFPDDMNLATQKTVLELIENNADLEPIGIYFMKNKVMIDGEVKTTRVWLYGIPMEGFVLYFKE